jgi:capsular exopolysaccharide synthesis family protein
MATIAGTSKEWELRDYLRVLRRRAVLVIGAAVVGAALAGASSELQTKQYEATAQVEYQRQASDQVFTSGNPAFDPKRDIQTEVKVLHSAAVQQATRDRIGHRPDVTISSDDTSNVIGVTAHAPSPSAAARDANQYAQTYVEYRHKQAVGDLSTAGNEVQSQIQSIDNRLAQLPANSSERSSLGDQRTYLVQQLSRLQVSANLSDAGGASLIAKAQPPSAPAAPKPMRNAFIGGALGLFVGLALAFLLEYLDDGVRECEQLEDALDDEIPVLAEIPFVRAWKKSHGDRLASIDSIPPGAAEAFRALRTSVLFLGVDREIRSIQITSAEEHEGKTSVAAHLAVAIGRAGRKVVVVSGDLRHARLHETFGLPNDVGLSTVLLGEATLNEALQSAPGEPYVAVLSAGVRPPNPSELLSAPRVRTVMASLAEVADVVVVDSPPVLPVTDALVIAGLVDASILVASAPTTSRRSLRRAALRLEQVGAHVDGTVLNEAKVGRGGFDAEAGSPPQPEPTKRTRHKPSTNGHQPEPEPEPVRS